MSWIKAKKYKYPLSQKRDKNFKAIPGVYDEPTYYNPKTKRYKHGESVVGQKARTGDKGDTEEEWKYLLFDHLASCEIDLPESWTYDGKYMGGEPPYEDNCIDLRRYDIYGQKRKKPVSQKKADAEYAAGELKHWKKAVRTKKEKGSLREGLSLFTMGV